MDLFDSQILLAAVEATQEAAGHAQEAAAVSNGATQETEQGLLGTFGIDWKLFIAQLVNFGVVLFIFWKWIVGPITGALQERQEKIEKGLQNAEDMEREREQFEKIKVQELKKARQEAESIIEGANQTAEKLKNDTLDQANEQSEKMIERAKSSIEQEKEQMLREVKGQMATLVTAATEKILQEKMDSRKDREFIKESISKVDKNEANA